RRAGDRAGRRRAAGDDSRGDRPSGADPRAARRPLVGPYGFAGGAGRIGASRRTHPATLRAGAGRRSFLRPWSGSRNLTLQTEAPTWLVETFGSLPPSPVRSASAATTRRTRASGTTRSGSSCASTAAGA